MSQENKLWYTRTERKSIVFLLVLVLVFNILGRVFQKSIRTSAYKPTFSLQTKPISHLSEKTSQKKAILELNRADSLKLLDLFGIGPVFAGRIIKYRFLLGGFCRKEQLLEVYGMDSIRYFGFEKQVWVDSLKIKKIYLGKVDFRGLLRHPYLDYQQVKSFMIYRDRHGPPNDCQDILNAKVWSDSTIFRIQPYLGFGEEVKK